MEVLGPIVGGLVAMALLAGVGLAAIIALMAMVVLHFLTEMSFRKVFLISAGIGLLGPILLGIAISNALADGSIQRDLRDEVGPYIELPDDQGAGWQDKLEQLQELSRQNDNGTLTDEEAEARVKEIFGDLEDLQISIDLNGDGEGNGISIGNGENGVELDLPEGVEVPRNEE